MISEAPPAPEAGDATELHTRFRLEHEAQVDPSLKAALLHESAVATEATGDTSGAARDHLAAFNTDASFREPLESLVAILSRRRGAKSLGRLLGALADAAETPQEKARANVERAAHLLDHEQDPAAAQMALEEAVSAHPEDAAAWLELELLAAKSGDDAAQAQALEARAEIANDPTWKGLLLVDVADLAARSGNFARAYELLDAAGALDGRARFRTRTALEAAALQEPNPEVVARALETQADLIADAITDPAAGDAAGVPARLRTPEAAADAWFRAADLKRRGGDAAGAITLLSRAAESLPDAAVVARARVAALEAAGDSEAAAASARREIERSGARGPGGAALWLRVAESAAIAENRGEALVALRAALEADPGSVPARALELDLAGDGEDPLAYAISLAASASALPTAEGRARTHLVEALVWALHVSDDASAREALERAGKEGAPVETRARVARMLAARRGAAAWYEDATTALLGDRRDAASRGEPGAAAEIASLLFELGRSRLLRGDLAAARAAWDELAAAGDADSDWLGRALAAYAKPPEGTASAGEGANGLADPAPLEALAAVETDAAFAFALKVAAAARALGAGDRVRARELLVALHESDAEQLATAVFLAELERRTGRLREAAVVLAQAAAAATDDELSAALFMEAALLAWRSNDKKTAIAHAEASRGRAPKASATLLYWALAGDPTADLETKRRALDLAAELGGEPTSYALQRFGLEIASLKSGGEVLEGLSALEALERLARGDLAIAAALARLALPEAAEDESAAESARAVLALAGPRGEALAAAERLREARAAGDANAAVEHAAAWARADGAEGGAAGALEWLLAATTAGDRAAEADARAALAASLGGDVAGAVAASAETVRLLADPVSVPTLVEGGSPAARLVNLEIAMPGGDPGLRARALTELGDLVGDDGRIDAIALSGWNELARLEPERAQDAFARVIEVRPQDLGAWEGARAAAAALGDRGAEARACSELGTLCRDDERAAGFWERAGLLFLELGAGHEAAAEQAFDRAFSRSASRSVAFDKLFRRLRARNDDDRLLDIVDRRLLVAEDEREIAKLFWERARVLRRKGDTEAALAAIDNVTMLEPDHVGALVLAGEISIAKGDFAGAAPLLARLAAVAEAPAQERLMGGIAASDFYETKLAQPEKALDVLRGLEKAGLSNAKVRERLARVAARVGSWDDAIAGLERLMRERETKAARAEAARLAMAIWRDKKKQPEHAAAAVTKLLEEIPDDAEALELVLGAKLDAGVARGLLATARSTLDAHLADDPTDLPRVISLTKLAAHAGDVPLRQATLGAILALGGAAPNGVDAGAELARIDARVPTRPEMQLGPADLAEIADPEDRGPLVDVFQVVAETLSLALGPSLESLGVGRKDRVASSGGHPLRMAVAEWMGAVGFTGDFEVYVGGREPNGVFAVAGEEPAIVLGAGIKTPLDAASRMAIAREVFGLRRGITALRHRDDPALASAVIAACIEAGVAMPAPSFAVYGEVSRGIKKEISRRVRKALAEPAARFAASGQDVKQWAAAARRSLDRASVIAAGDVSLVLATELGVARGELASAVKESDRAKRLLRFVLSQRYLDLRRRLGMGAR